MTIKNYLVFFGVCVVPLLMSCFIYYGMYMFTQSQFVSVLFGLILFCKTSYYMHRTIEELEKIIKYNKQVTIWKRDLEQEKN